MVKVKARYTDYWMHVSVLITGLRKLQEIGAIELELVKETDEEKNHQAGMEMDVNGLRVYLDVSDGYNNLSFIRDHINDYDIWFKRSFSEKLNKEYGLVKIVPLGLNYGVFDSFVSRVFKRESTKTFLLRFIGIKPDFEIGTRDYECVPKLNEVPQICFTARLWSGEENREINEMRILLVRELRRKYGSSFHGGIYKSAESEAMCPDLIVNKIYTQKNCYLKRMKSCDICIATTGLHGSIGWKLAEYVMASKVVLTEPLNYYVPYGFSNGSNYLEFSSVDECMSLIDSLLNSPERMRAIMQSNYDYYRESLNAGSMMRKIIDICLKRDEAYV